METVLTKENFQSEVLNSQLPILVDFWAAWCGPCRAIAPALEELAKEYEGKFRVGKLNVDEQSEIASQYGVMSLPTLKIFYGGKIVGEIVGAAPKSAIEEEIKKFVTA